MDKLALFFIGMITTLGSLQINGQTTVMSFNIRYDTPDDKHNWWENRKGDVAALVDFYHPDFLGIQEGLHHQVQFLLEGTRGYRYIGVGRDDGALKGEYCAIFYDAAKFQLINDRTFWLSPDPDTISVGWDASMERICTYGHFKERVSGRQLHVFNTHFDHIGEEARKQSAQLLMEKIKEYGLTDASIVVMGDLNCEPASEPIAILLSILDDGLALAGREFSGPPGTFNGFDPQLLPQRRIDYILTKNLKVSRYLHIDARRKNNLCVSDHLPVLAEVVMD